MRDSTHSAATNIADSLTFLFLVGVYMPVDLIRKGNNPSPPYFLNKGELMDGLTVSYEKPYNFVLWDGPNAIRKYETVPKLLEALSVISRDVLFKASAVKASGDTLFHTAS